MTTDATGVAGGRQTDHRSSAGSGTLIAVFPVENLSGTSAPVREIAEDLKRGLSTRKIGMLDGNSLESFMTKHRVRYTGGVTRELGRAFRSELSVDAVLVISLDLYDESAPPKVGMTARLVSTGDETTIDWMDSISMTGDQNPGLLGIGLVTDPGKLRARVLDRFADSILLHLSGKSSVSSHDEKRTGSGKGGGRGGYLPRGSFRMPTPQVLRGYGQMKMAVLPFLDRSGRTYAGELVANLFLKGFADAGVAVVEPGVVRQSLLQSRLIMEGGLSFPQAELLRELLGVDYVVSGEVIDYQDSRGYDGAPYIEYSVYIIDAARRQVVWTSSSYERGDEHVRFFDWGKTYTAAAIVSETVKAVTGMFLGEYHEPGPEAIPPIGQRLGGS